MAQTTRTAKKQPTNQELSRWCVEMAMRWPVTHYNHGGLGAQVYGQNIGRTDVDADVIGRAQKIYDWVSR